MLLYLVKQLLCLKIPEGCTLGIAMLALLSNSRSICTSLSSLSFYLRRISFSAYKANQFELPKSNSDCSVFLVRIDSREYSTFSLWFLSAGLDSSLFWKMKLSLKVSGLVTGFLMNFCEPTSFDFWGGLVKLLVLVKWGERYLIESLLPLSMYTDLNRSIDESRCKVRPSLDFLPNFPWESF